MARLFIGLLEFVLVLNLEPFVDCHVHDGVGLHNKESLQGGFEEETATIKLSVEILRKDVSQGERH